MNVEWKSDYFTRTHRRNGYKREPLDGGDKRYFKRWFWSLYVECNYDGGILWLSQS